MFARSILARFGLKDDHFRYNFWIVIGCRFSFESKRVFLAFFLVWLRPGRVWWSQKPGESVFGGFEVGWFYWSENARFYGIKETSRPELHRPGGMPRMRPSLPRIGRIADSYNRMTFTVVDRLPHVPPLYKYKRMVHLVYIVHQIEQVPTFAIDFNCCVTIFKKTKIPLLRSLSCRYSHTYYR